MHEPPNPEPQPTARQPDDAFFGARDFPNLGAFPEATRSAQAPAGGRSASRLILPIILFVVAIGGIAWVTQYLPNWRVKKPPAPASEKPAKAEVISFQEYRPDPETSPGLYQAVWEQQDKSYAKEFERGIRGHYDFPFKNATDKPVELGLLRTSCDCSKVEVVTFSEGEWQLFQEKGGEGKPLQWQPLKADETKGTVLPPGHHGLLRLSWEARKAEGERLRLTLNLWAQPKDDMRKREFPALETLVVLVPPVRFLQDRLPFEVVTPGAVVKKELVCWSATRPELKLTIADHGDPLLACEARPLTSKECQELQKKLSDSMNTRVLSGFRVSVALHEQKDGKQMDQGAFERHLPLLLDGQPLETAAPTVHGTVQGDVEVGGPDDRGKIQLRTFQARDGVKRTVILSAPKGVILEPVSQKPPYVSVTLAPDAKASTGTRGKWTIEVTVPAGSPAGPLPQDSAIILRSQGPSPRMIRIPLIGNAVQG